MKKIILFICFIFTFSLNAQSHDDTTCTSIYLIRHAEKDRTDSNNSNPHLNSLGKERSLRWKTFFKNIEFDEFYSTNYHRTIETIKPISNGREIVIYNPSTINYKDFILLNADSIWNLARNKETNEIGVVWNSFSERADASCQSSALDAFNAALIITN